MDSQIIYPGKIIIGSCSICGGPVLVHESWFCAIPDVPTCAKCGATKADSHGPVIPMAPAAPWPTTTLTTGSLPNETDQQRRDSGSNR